MKKLKNYGRRAAALFLVLVMCLSLANLTAFAEELTSEEPNQESQLDTTGAPDKENTEPNENNTNDTTDPADGDQEDRDTVNGDQENQDTANGDQENQDTANDGQENQDTANGGQDDQDTANGGQDDQENQDPTGDGQEDQDPTGDGQEDQENQDTANADNGNQTSTEQQEDMVVQIEANNSAAQGSDTGIQTAEDVPVTGVTLDTTAIEVEIGSTVTLTATVTPDDATDKTITWTSGNEAIATVDGNGRITAVAAGEATITAVANGLSAFCKVTVTEKATPATWDEMTGTLTISNVDTVTWELVQAWLKELGTNLNSVTTLNLNNIGTVPAYALFSTRLNSLEALNINGVGTIGDHAFFKKAALKTVNLSDVETVESNAFSESKALTTVTLNNVDTLGDEAFRQCSALEGELKLTKENVQALGRSVFSYCTSLTSVELDGVELTGNTTFFNCEGIQTVIVKNTSISDGTFTGCTALATATLENIGSIGLRAFSVTGGGKACTSLETVNMTNVTTTGQEAFVSCSSLKNVNMTGVTAIGINSFASCKALETITIPNGMETIGRYAFYNCTGLKSTIMGTVDTIGQYAFQNCTGLTTVEMGAVETIDNYAFWNCSSLESIESLSNVTGSIGGFAFYGCSNLKGLTVADLTKMGYNGSVEMMKRMEEILAGKFQLGNVAAIEMLTPDPANWTARDVARSANWNAYDNGIQLMEQARWQNATDGVAQVQVDAYYTGEKQMDYIFVADLSASMAQLGNPEDNNARFYDMQSKLLDMTGKLLGTPGYDCQVSIVTFGGYFNNNQTVGKLDFTKDAGVVEEHIKSLEPLNENTDYKLGLNATLDVLKSQQSGRHTIVVFLSDGRPTQDGQTALKTITQLNAYNAEIAELAKQIKDAGADNIYGVLHSPTATVRDNALASMESVCSLVYESTDTESFGEAMNAAFASVYGNNAVRVPVNAEQFDVGSLHVTSGEAVYNDGVITWTLNGMPFTDHQLTYTLSLKDELRTQSGRYNTNNGNTTFGPADGDNVTASVSVGVDLALTYTAPSTGGGGGGSSTTYYTLRIEYTYEDGTSAAAAVTRSLASGSRYSVASPAIEGYTASQTTVSGTLTGNVTVTVTYTADEVSNIPDENTPTGETPNENPGDETDIPDSNVPQTEQPEQPGDETELPENDIPMDEAPQTGDSRHTALWSVTFALSLGGLVLLGKKKKEEA